MGHHLNKQNEFVSDKYPLAPGYLLLHVETDAAAQAAVEQYEIGLHEGSSGLPLVLGYLLLHLETRKSHREVAHLFALLTDDDELRDDLLIALEHYGQAAED